MPLRRGGSCPAPSVQSAPSRRTLPLLLRDLADDHPELAVRAPRNLGHFFQDYLDLTDLDLQLLLTEMLRQYIGLTRIGLESGGMHLLHTVGITQRAAELIADRGALVPG